MRFHAKKIPILIDPYGKGAYRFLIKVFGGSSCKACHKIFSLSPIVETLRQKMQSTIRIVPEPDVFPQNLEMKAPPKGAASLNE
jgi:hypothetical protein